MNDLIDSVLSMHLDVYRQSETQDSDTGEAHTGTGNAYADKLLADYVLTTKVEII